MEGEIPVIDLEAENNNEGNLNKVMERWSCFRLVNHGIPTKLMAEMKQVAKQLFDRPIEIKRQNVDVIPGSGYMAPSVKNPLYEAYGLFDVASSISVSNFCSHLQATDYQREIIESYARAICKTATNIATKMAASLGLTGYSFEDWLCQFRINKYTFTPESIGASGVQIHTDSSFLTVLHDDEDLGGLEVMNYSGEFVAVHPYPGTLIVNFGDAVVPWSNGTIRNVLHRVQCKGVGIRISIATFLSPPPEKVIEAPLEFVDDDHPRRYAAVTYQELRRLRAANNMHCGEVIELIRLDK